MARFSQAERRTLKAQFSQWIDDLFAYDQQHPYATDLKEAGPPPPVAEEETDIEAPTHLAATPHPITPEDRTEIAKRAWDTRGRNKSIESGTLPIADMTREEAEQQFIKGEHYFDSIYRTGQPQTKHPFFSRDIMTMDILGAPGDLTAYHGVHFEHPLKVASRREASVALLGEDIYAPILHARGGKKFQPGDPTPADLTAADNRVGEAARAAGYDAIVTPWELQVIDTSRLPEPESVKFDEQENLYTDANGIPLFEGIGWDRAVARAKTKHLTATPHPLTPEERHDIAIKAWDTRGRTGTTLEPTTERAWSGEPTGHRSLSKLETGAVGERIAIDYLKSLGFADARSLSVHGNNFPVDLIQDHKVYEVKAGLASNGPSAQQWRATQGEPGPKEKAWLATASDKEKAIWNLTAQRRILQRKQRAVARIEKELGHPIQRETIGLIVNPDTHTVDLYRLNGFHLRVGWHSDEAMKGYVGSYKY